jgi:hypothetical protein
MAWPKPTCKQAMCLRNAADRQYRPFLALGSIWACGITTANPSSLPEFYGNYLALEGGVERNEIAANYLNRMRRQMPTSLTPSLYVLWGTQHRIRHFALYDLNAGLGVLAPPYYNFEHIGAAHYDVAAQVNIRIYYGFGF